MVRMPRGRLHTLDRQGTHHQGERVTACQNCGRHLTDPESIQRGIGPECASIAAAGGGTLRYRVLESDKRVLAWARDRLEAGRGLTTAQRRKVQYVLDHPERFQ